MPIYEFYCDNCHRIFSFLSRTIDTNRIPDCPRCGRAGLARRVSPFAISKGRKESEAGDEAMPNIDETKLMRIMEELGPEAEKMSDEDPRQAARVMRRLFDAAGLPVVSGMEEALRRMEAGEDPEKVEQELGDVLGEDPFSAAESKKTLSSLRRRALPPSVDPNLYEL
ncbi:MAG: zinc ribbon domain-containing protein [Vicinamibacteria bacterium]|nr:zinc ribbon domain-containing protein [Vicinamibacteria bacterium]